MKKYPSQIADQYVVKFPDGMREHIKEQAKENERSMNAEIIFRLQQAYKAMSYVDAWK